MVDMTPRQLRKEWIELIYYVAGIVALSSILGMVIWGLIWHLN